MDLKRLLKDEYGLVPQSISQYKTTLRVTTSQGDFAVKSYSWKDKVPFITSMLSHLRNKGFLHLLQIVPSAEGKLYTEIDDKRIIVTRWVQGNTPNWSNLNSLKQAAELLAQFHHHAVGLITPPRGTKGTVDELIYPPSWVFMSVGQYRNGHILCRLLEWERQHGFDWLKQAVDITEQALRTFPADDYAQLIEEERRNYAFVHGDYNYSNVVCTDNQRLTMIDFDGCSLNARITDLAFLIQLHGCEPNRARMILNSYTSIRPLSLIESRVLYSLLQIPALAFRKLHGYVFAGNEISYTWGIERIVPLLKCPMHLHSLMKNMLLTYRQ